MANPLASILSAAMLLRHSAEAGGRGGAGRSARSARCWPRATAPATSWRPGATRLGTEAMGDAVVRAIRAEGVTTMTITTRRAALGLALSAPAFVARAQGVEDWPNRTIRLDRRLRRRRRGRYRGPRRRGQKSQEILGQSVVIENRTGGNAVIAANATLQSPRDGYTFLVDAANQLTNPPLMKDLGFDYRTAFVAGHAVLPVPAGDRGEAGLPGADDPASSSRMAKARPNAISYGTPPAAGMAHLAGEVFQKRAGIRLIHTPYRGGADAARDITAGVVDAVLITTSSIRPPVQAGQARVLAVTSPQRVPTCRMCRPSPRAASPATT